MPTKPTPHEVPQVKTGSTNVGTPLLREATPHRPGEISALPFGQSVLPQPFRKSATSVDASFLAQAKSNAR